MCRRRYRGCRRRRAPGTDALDENGVRAGVSEPHRAFDNVVIGRLVSRAVQSAATRRNTAVRSADPWYGRSRSVRVFNRNRCLRRVAAIASISALVAGCGVLSSDTPEDEGPIVVGTTSAPSTLDPAASWDGSWELFRNIYQTLLSYPVGSSTPKPDAAENCE